MSEPPCLYAPICLYAHTFICPRGVHTPICPHTLLCLCFLAALHVVGGCNGLPFVLQHPPLHHPCLGVPPHNYTPTLSHWFPVHQYVSGISVCYVGISLLLKGLGVFPPSVGRHQHLRCPYAHSCTFFVVHYVSHLTTALTTTPPVTVVSSGLSSVSSVTGFPVSLDQHGMVPPPPLMPRGSGGVLGSVSVPQQQPPSSMPPLAYANYAMGSPQVGFFFRVEPPISISYICLVSILVSTFYF